MKTGIGAIALGMGLIALPTQALPPQERVNLGLGLQVVGCVLGAPCGGYAPRYVVPSPGFGVIPRGRRVISPGFGVVPHRGVLPRRFYDARAEIDPIYREVLGRPADWDGLRTYQARLDEGWSLSQIRNDIANSTEARSRW
ncbi:MAG: hypothetical protein ACUVSQ_10855 [Pseudanabaenaceae cyanobacterium]